MRELLYSLLDPLNVVRDLLLYDSWDNLTEDKYLHGENSKNALVHFYCQTVVYCALRKSKRLKISYDWRGMPVEFVHDVSDAKDAYKLVMAYDASGRRISKTRMKESQNGTWWTELVTHYTGIGTEIRENPVNHEVKVVMNMPNGLGRYEPEDAAVLLHLQDVRVVPEEPSRLDHARVRLRLRHPRRGQGRLRLPRLRRAGDAHGIRRQGDREHFTGKEKDDETELNYFGARYLDPMLGMWISVDPARQFASPYLYAGNGFNPVNGVDPDGNSVNILLSNEKSGSYGFVYKYKSYQIKAKPELGKYRRRVPRYNMYIGNNSGSDAIIEVTRDAIAGNGPFIANGSFRGWPLFNAPNGYRIELRDPKTLSRTILDDKKQKRSYVQIHLGPGCSEGCSLLPDGKKGRDRFQEIIETMQKEDLDNGFDDDIFVDTEKFDPAFTPKDVPGPDVH